jgi:hypothetical protein
MIDECIDVCAMNYNILVVCAAGNIAHNNDWFWPAANEKALAVSAIDDNGAFPYGYHQGLYIDCCAPGINVYCLEPGGTCNPRSGTSFSAPQVSALAAWIFSINPNLQWFEVYNIITMTCNTAGLVDYDSSKFGYGLINMDKADSLTRIWYELESFPGNKPASDNMVQVLDNNFRIDSCPNPFNPQSELTFDLPSAGLVELVIYDITGREVAVLQNEILPPGTYHRVFEGAELASGVYFACLQVQGERLTRKIILLK